MQAWDLKYRDKNFAHGEDVRLYLGYGALAENGLKIQAVNSR